MASPGPHPVLEVDFPSRGLVMGGITEAAPSAVFDTLLETASAADGDLVLTSIVQARGIPPAALERLKAELVQRYGPIEFLQQLPKEQSYVLRTHMPLAKVQSPTLRFLVRFQHEFKMPWTHIEAGRATLRSEVQDPVLAEQLVPRMESFFRAGKLDARIGFVELTKEDLALRDRLLRLAKTAPQP